jgi:hypothetical protein
MRQVLARTSWDATAAAMEQLIEDALRRRSATMPLAAQAS